MDNNNQSIPSDQQVSLIESLVKAGVLSPESLQSHVQENYGDAPQPQGINIDPTTLHSIIQNAIKPNSVPMQQGDQMHPMDAIAKIGQGLNSSGGVGDSPEGPAAPSGVSNATGPALQISPNKQIYGNAPLNSPVGKLLGLSKKVYANGPNYFSSAQTAGIDKYLPTGLAQMPDGTPFVPKDVYDQAKMTAAFGLTQKTAANKNVSYTTPEQIESASGGRVTGEDAKQMLAQFGGNVPDVVMQRALAGDKNGVMEQMMSFRKQQVENAALNTYLKYSGAGLAQKAGSESVTRLVNLQRAQAIADQISANGGTADVRQRTEFASSIARAINPTGVLTNEALNLYIPDSLKGKFGNFQEYMTNTRTPVDFTGFLPAMQDLLNREIDVNKGVLSNVTQFSNPALANLKRLAPGLAVSANATANNNPLIPPPTPTTPKQGTWRVVR